MRIALKIVVGAMLVVMIVMVLTFGRGPVGPESVAGKEVEDYVERAALNANAMIFQVTSAEPGILTLPSGMELKRRVKRALAFGFMTPARENAMQFIIQRQDSRVRCLVVLRGDHVMGIAVIHDDENSEFASQFRSALEMQFDNYEIQQLREGA